MPLQIDYTYYDSPIGALLLAGTETALHLLSFPTGSRTKQPQDGWRENADTFAPVITQLKEYFAGTRLEFDCLAQIFRKTSGWRWQKYLLAKRFPMVRWQSG